MRADISDELLDAINERIYLDLEIHVLTAKLNKSDSEGFSNYINKLITNVIKQRKELNDYLTSNGVKIYDVQEIDDMFVKYPYSQKINGGYKEGYQQFWKDAIRYKLKKRMNKYFER
jgi:hypothetical protein